MPGEIEKTQNAGMKERKTGTKVQLKKACEKNIVNKWTYGENVRNMSSQNAKNGHIGNELPIMSSFNRFIGHIE